MTVDVANMRQFAESLSERNGAFESDLFAYGNSFLTDNYRILMTYSPKGQEPIFYPNIGVIGLLGIKNIWHLPVETCLRYLLLEGACKELGQAEQILDNIYDRIVAGREMDAQGLLNEQAKATLEQMSLKLAIITAGIGLVEDMIKNKSVLSSSMDKDNEIAQKWCKVYS